VLRTSSYGYFTAVFTVSLVKQQSESSYTFNFKVPTVTWSHFGSFSCCQ